MSQRFTARLPRWVIPSVVGAVLISFVAIYFCFMRDPHAPTAIVVTACHDMAPGMRRITADFGTGFDVPEKTFSIHAGVQDMPPERAYTVTLRGSTGYIAISHDDADLKVLKDNLPVFSRRVKAKNNGTGKERSVGTDRWGYRKSGERWRYVAFSSGDAVGYLPTPPKEAVLLDQVISSACLLPAQHSQK